MSIPFELQSVLTSNPETLSGAVRFKGTRVPVQALLDTLADGKDIYRFLYGWPDVDYDQAMAVINWEQQQARNAFGLEGLASITAQTT